MVSPYYSQRWLTQVSEPTKKRVGYLSNSARHSGHKRSAPWAAEQVRPGAVRELAHQQRVLAHQCIDPRGGHTAYAGMGPNEFGLLAIGWCIGHQQVDGHIVHIVHMGQHGQHVGGRVGASLAVPGLKVVVQVGVKQRAGVVCRLRCYAYQS